MVRGWGAACARVLDCGLGRSLGIADWWRTVVAGFGVSGLDHFSAFAVVLGSAEASLYWSP